MQLTKKHKIHTHKHNPGTLKWAQCDKTQSRQGWKRLTFSSNTVASSGHVKLCFLIHIHNTVRFSLRCVV